MYATKIPSDERSLVLRLIEGEEDAFCELYAAYKNRLIYFAMRFLKSREYAEDIFQDAFTIVWQGRRFINPDASFSAYLYTIVRNRILNQLRDLSYQDKLYCCPINSIKYKNVVFGHCVFSGRVLFYSSMPPQKIDNW